MNDGRLTTVVVRRAALESARQPGKAGDLVQAVVQYVNDVMREGVYHGQELPVAAAQAYHADFYLGQVMNGGHSQFIGNSDTNYPKTSADALAGLKAMGARVQHQILAEMIDWAKAHPEEVAPHNDFGSGNKLLREFNTRFYAVEKQSSMIEHSANWISGWPELRVVEDSEYAAEITRLAQLNPYLSSRKIWQGTRLLRYRMTDRLQLTVAAACGAVTPEPEIMLVVRPGSQMEIEG